MAVPLPYPSPHQTENPLGPPLLPPLAAEGTPSTTTLQWVCCTFPCKATGSGRHPQQRLNSSGYPPDFQSNLSFLFSLSSFSLPFPFPPLSPFPCLFHRNHARLRPSCPTKPLSTEHPFDEGNLAQRNIYRSHTLLGKHQSAWRHSSLDETIRKRHHPPCTIIIIPTPPHC